MIKKTMASVDSHSLSKLIKPVLYPVFKDIKKSYDYEEHGGTLLLGVNGLVMKCHGSSNEKAIENALLKTQQSYDNKLLNDLEELLEAHTFQINKDTE